MEFHFIVTLSTLSSTATVAGLLTAPVMATEAEIFAAVRVEADRLWAESSAQGTNPNIMFYRCVPNVAVG